MNTASRSVFVFGLYLSVVGLILLVAPNILLSLIGVEKTSEVWIRLSGLLLMALSVYYFVATYHQLFIIYKVTVYIRCSIILFFGAFVYLGLMEPVMIFFAVLDFLGGIWTMNTMKKEGIWQ